jgi:hypothetical protein
MNRPSNRFARGSGVYRCNCCKRSTRSTGRGDNEMIGLCAECFDLGGEENHLSDTGELSNPEAILSMIQTVTDKGGDASCWDELKKAAEAAKE